MLTEFSVENYRSFENKITFNFGNVRDYQFNSNCISHGFVNKAIIYGRNGVGKTNFVNALMDIQLTLLLRSMDIQDNSYINANTSNAVAGFCYKFLFDTDVVEYSYKKTDVLHLSHERLVINQNEVFSFDFATGRFDKLDLAIIDCEGIDYEKFTQPEVLEDVHSREVSFLGWIYTHSKLQQDALVYKIIEFAKNIVSFSPTLNTRFINKTVDGFIQTLENEEELKKLQDFFSMMGIEVKLVVKKDPEGELDLYCQYNQRIIRFIQTASSGAKQLLKLYAHVLSKVKNGSSCVVLDEFDAYYHYELAIKLIEYFKERYPDVKVIFTSHNTSLISNRILRPDCYFILSSDRRLTSLCDATERELREGHNLEKMYKSGEFSRYE